MNFENKVTKKDTLAPLCHHSTKVFITPLR